MPNAPILTAGPSMPGRMVRGAFYQLQRTPPHPPAGWSVTGGKLYIRDEDDTQLVADGIVAVVAQGQDFYNFDIGGSVTAEATLGTYTAYTQFDIRLDSDHDRTEIVADYHREVMLVEVPENISQDQVILDLLLDTLERKLAGRGDIVQYTIGDRQLGTMSLADLNMAISHWRARVDRYPKLRAIGQGDRYGLRHTYTGYRGGYRY